MSLLGKQIKNDQGLIEGIRNHDEQVIRHLYHDFFPRILAMVVKNNGNENDAQDLFHDGLIVFYRKVKEEDFIATSSLSTFLYAICQNLWRRKLNRDTLHKKVTKSFSKELLNDYSVEDTMEKEDRFDLYKEKFSLLSPSCQKCLSMFFQGKNMQEIAESLNLSGEGSARKKKFKCKEKLIDLIRSDPRFDELND